jgi:hypothetical protein
MHPRAVSSVEHPRWDFAVVPAIVVVHFASEHGPYADFSAVHDNVLTVQRVPGIVHPANIGLVITLVGACTMDSTITRLSLT